MKVGRYVVTPVLLCFTLAVGAGPSVGSVTPPHLLLEPQVTSEQKVSVGEGLGIPVAAKKKVIPRPRVQLPSRSYSGNVADIIRQVAAEKGCTGEEIPMLFYIANKESTMGMNPRAYETGRKYIGLFQLNPGLGSTENRLDDRWNTGRAIDYMWDRYGSIEKAYRFHLVNNWF